MSASSYEPLSPKPFMSKTKREMIETRRAAARRMLCGLLATDSQADNASESLTALGAQWLRGHGLVALAWTRYHQAIGLPIEVMAELSGGYYAAVADAELHRRELEAVLQALNGQGSVPVLFKGAALAFTVYSDPACRSMGDLDLWLTDAEMLRARIALESMGYLHAVKADRPLSMMMQNSGEVRLNGSRAGQGLVEWRLVNWRLVNW